MIDINPRKVHENASDDLKTLPEWVKCMICHKPPLENDWLVEVVPHSNALMHQSCAAGQGKIAGINIGSTQGELK